VRESTFILFYLKCNRVICKVILSSPCLCLCLSVFGPPFALSILSFNGVSTK
jgi:hypothetical protein